eukprot:CAMPEP_0171163358 /NCGR_PEP_ID=MMETSP0790-20130122/5099_1 /TAXON_ID=2925 /ORGANISM="Alexandrium catenella, Strain OF101" /LENGTH=710 /DNA_ID=CAMNT_0011628055 /DNA_START=53 /DNA_END=2185 /DNA_ORIENTATION=+
MAHPPVATHPSAWTRWIALLALADVALRASALLVYSPPEQHPMALRIEGKNFMLNDKKVHLHAGEMHYFRIPEVYWEDRLMRLRAMGLNTVSTYVPWNWHEEVEGSVDFSSERRNLVKYLEIAHKLGLMVILRPGPYICAEWEFGGLPSWLLRHHDLKVRTYDTQYLEYVDRYWADLLTRVKPQLFSEGGGIVAVLIENEFGHFGDAAASAADKAYLKHLHALARQYLGPNVMLLSTDDSISAARGKGSIPNVYSAVNMGPWEVPKPHLDREFSIAQYHNHGGPEFVMELWTGWFQQVRWDPRYEMVTRVKGQTLADYVAELVNRSASFTLYMAHGGTNFGFWNSGAFGPGAFVATSYDYIAPISEAGRHNVGSDGVDKFEAIREVLAGYAIAAGEAPPPPEPAPPRLETYAGGGEIALTRRSGIRSPAVLGPLCAGGWRSLEEPGTMEDLHQHVGMTLYRYRFTGDEAGVSSGSNHSQLNIRARDRVTVWQDKQMLAKLWTKWMNPLRVFLPKSKVDSMDVEMARTEGTVPLKKGAVVDILTENLGRMAFFQRNTTDSRASWDEWKGISEAKLNGVKLTSNWEVCSLPLEDLKVFSKGVPSAEEEQVDSYGPAFYEGEVQVSGEPADTFLRLDSGPWHVGVAYVNGFNLGRYTSEAPAPFDFYVPKNVLRTGANQVVLLEMDENGAEVAPVRMTSVRAPENPKNHKWHQ